MQTVNMHKAKTQLSKLVDQAAKGEPFIIAKAGKPLVKVVAIEPEVERKPKRLGFMPGLQIPDDFDTLYAGEIAAMFEGDD